MAWLDPSLRKQDLAWAYARYFTHDAEAEATRRRRRAFLRIYEALLLLAGPGWARRRRARMYLSGTPGKLLDVGCGDGTLLEAMQRQGWQVEGIDFDPISVKDVAARLGVRVTCADIEEAALAKNTYDGVTLQHVIEHVPDPQAALRRAYEVLAPGGRLVVVTPNFESTYRRRFGKDWWPLEVPRHLHLYSRKSMEKLLSNLGWMDFKVSTTAANNDSVYISSRRIRATGSRGLDPHYSPVEIMRAFAALWWSWATSFLRPDAGEELVVVVQKPSATPPSGSSPA